MKKRCNICNDKGYYREYNKQTHKYDILLCECVLKKCICKNDEQNEIENDGFYIKDNKIYECPCRKPRLRIQRINYLLSNTDLNRKFKYKFLSDIKNKIHNKEIPHIRDIKGSIMLLLKNIKKNIMPNGIVLYSDTKGNGKTLAASVILNEIIYNYIIEGKYIKLSSSYFRKLRNSYQQSSEEYGTESYIIEQYVNVDALVIDDFGTQKNTQWEQEKLYELIDGRYEKEKITIITSNLNDFDNIDKLINKDRVYSRLAEMCSIVKVKTPSYRLNFRKK